MPNNKNGTLWYTETPSLSLYFFLPSVEAVDDFFVAANPKGLGICVKSQICLKFWPVFRHCELENSHFPSWQQAETMESEILFWLMFMNCANHNMKTYFFVISKAVLNKKEFETT